MNKEVHGEFCEEYERRKSVFETWTQDDTDASQASKNPQRLQAPHADTFPLTFTADSCFCFHRAGIRPLWKSAHPSITDECVIDASWLPPQ